MATDTTTPDTATTATPAPAPAPAPVAKPAKTTAAQRIDAAKAAALEAGAQLGVQGAREFQAAQRDIGAQKQAALETFGAVGKTAGFTAAPTFSAGITGAYENRLGALRQGQANFMATNLLGQQQIGNYLTNAAVAAPEDVSAVLRRSSGGGRGGGGSRGGGGGKLTSTGLAGTLYQNAAETRQQLVGAFIDDVGVKQKALAGIAAARKKLEDQGFVLRGGKNGPSETANRSLWDEARTVYLRQHPDARAAYNDAYANWKKNKKDAEPSFVEGFVGALTGSSAGYRSSSDKKHNLNWFINDASKRYGVDTDQIYRAGMALEGHANRNKDWSSADATRWTRDVFSYYKPRGAVAGQQLAALDQYETAGQQALNKQLGDLAKQGSRPLLSIATDIAQDAIKSGLLTDTQVANALNKPGLSATWEKQFANDNAVDFSGQQRGFDPATYGKQQGWDEARVAKAATFRAPLYKRKDGSLTVNENDADVVVQSKDGSETQTTVGSKEYQKNPDNWQLASVDQGPAPSLYGSFLNMMLDNKIRVGSWGLAKARVLTSLGTLNQDQQDAFDMAAEAAKTQYADQRPTTNPTDAYINSILRTLGY